MFSPQGDCEDFESSSLSYSPLPAMIDLNHQHSHHHGDTSNEVNDEIHEIDCAVNFLEPIFVDITSHSQSSFSTTASDLYEPSTVTTSTGAAASSSSPIGLSALGEDDVDFSDLESLEQKLLEELRAGMAEPSRRGKVKRPLNPFMVFSRAERSRLTESAPGMNNAKLSKILGEKWRALSQVERIPYRRCAERLKDLHKEMFPNYKYEPQKKSCDRDDGAHKATAAATVPIPETVITQKKRIAKRKHVCDTENQHRTSDFPSQLPARFEALRSARTSKSNDSNNRNKNNPLKEIITRIGEPASSAATKTTRSPPEKQTCFGKYTMTTKSADDDCKDGAARSKFVPTSNSISFRLDQNMRRGLTRSCQGGVINISQIMGAPVSPSPTTAASISPVRSSPMMMSDLVASSSPCLDGIDVLDGERDRNLRIIPINDRLAAAMHTCGLPVMDDNSLSSFLDHHEADQNSELDQDLEAFTTTTTPSRAGMRRQAYNSSPGPMFSESSRDFGLGSSELLSEVDQMGSLHLKSETDEHHHIITKNNGDTQLQLIISSSSSLSNIQGEDNDPNKPIPASPPSSGHQSHHQQAFEEFNEYVENLWN